MLHGGFSLGKVCDSAIPVASERAKTTTIALCQGVDRFTHIVEDDAEHGYQQHSASLRHPAALGLWSTLPQGQSAPWV